MFRSPNVAWRFALCALPVSLAIACTPAVAFAAEAPTRTDAPPSGAVVGRTDFTTTTDTGGGQMVTRSYPEQVNFQTPSGAWKAIDRDLQPGADGTVHPEAVDGDASIPSSLTDPVELKHDGETLTFRLRGADGDRDVAGTKASFDDALPHVDVSYASRALGLKETLVLSSKDAPSSYSYDITGDDSLTAAIDSSGDLVMTDSSGVQKFRISAPLAWDSASPTQYSDAIKLAVDKTSAGHWTLTMTPDAAWLNAPSRVYPVSVDPDFYWVSDNTERFHGATQDCYLSGGVQANTSYCAASTLAMGYYNRPYRPILKFDLSSAIPSNAIISAAQMEMYLPGSTTHAAISSRVHTLTSDWDNNATWNNRKTSTPWSTSGGGGDYSSAANLTGAANTAVGNGGYWYYWDVPLDAVKGWVNGTLPNYGLLLSADSETSATNAYSFVSTDGDQASWPAIDITWQAPDTTPPSAPTNLALGGLDAENGTADLTFVDGADPAVAHQVTSGFDHSEVRFHIAGQSFGSWQTATAGDYQLSGLHSGDTVSVEVRSLDHAGNASTSSTGSFTATVLSDAVMESQLADSEFASQYGVTTAVADAWLGTQAASRQLEADIQSSSSASTYAAMWFDNAARVVHVNMLNASQDSQVHSMAVARGVDNAIEIDHVANTYDQVSAKALVAENDLNDLQTAGKLRIGTLSDATGVRFLVATSATSADNARIQSEGAGLGVPYTIVQSSAATLTVTPLACTRNYDNRGQVPHTQTRCDPPLRAGVEMESTAGACTTGFAAQGIDSPYTRYMLTVGHCLSGQGQTWGITNPGATPSGTTTIGTVAQKLDMAATGNDAGLITINTASLRSPLNNWAYILKSGTGSTTTNPRYSITTTGRSGLGDYVCLSGAATGGHCGRVVDLNENFRTAGAVETCGLVHGDSGAPVVHQGAALGMVEGIANDDPCKVYYESAYVASTALRVKILQSPLS